MRILFLRPFPRGVWRYLIVDGQQNKVSRFSYVYKCPSETRRQLNYLHYAKNQIKRHVVGMCLSMNVLYAQTSDELKESSLRMEKLEKLSKKAPKETGIASIDGLAGSTTLVMVESIAITPILNNLYYRSIGQTEDGVTDVTVKKPTVEECVTLSQRITEQSIAVKATNELVKKAADELKTEKNPMKLAKATKSLDYSKDALGIVGLETTFQLKAIESIIETVKSTDNL